MTRIDRIAKKINRVYPHIVVSEKDGCVRLTGEMDRWDDVLSAGKMAVSGHFFGVLNDIKLAGFTQPPIKRPVLDDDRYDGAVCDVLVIGGGVIGCSIARELTRYNIKVILVEKQSDVATMQSARNDGAIHVGIDLPNKTKKLHYLARSNCMYEQLSAQLDFPFTRHGQYVLSTSWWHLPIMLALKVKAMRQKITNLQFMGRRKLAGVVPNLSKNVKFGILMDKGGCVCPYGMTIAYADNAVQNGAKILLNTIVTGMDVTDGVIIGVHTNRGIIKPRVVVNAAGVYADVIAEYAQDRFYTIHPRRGTNLILDRQSKSHIINDAGSISMYLSRKLRQRVHSKGGGILQTVDDNVLVGPDSVETPYREDHSTTIESINAVMSKHALTSPTMSNRDIINYFTGVRSATYEEDFVIEYGKKTTNIVHVAGIQSPGLSAAPAIAIDVSKMAVVILTKYRIVLANNKFNPVRKGVTNISKLSIQERDELIRINPNYGEIVCRCEGISKGEILDALHLPLCVPTLDGIKRRVRAGMGRCQGAFCQPLIMDIIKEDRGLPYDRISKKGEDRVILSVNKE
ncbi:MAG: NAD(P)/FAD-dependent oxidoreductase [Clostridia bacterium]|nr:NAD(P)/FAD-dependent oxidoreductase [Clostridia bacterium]